ncbi:type II toxin-antitoxin system antitoxin SocA domain-containing protein [uncultured Clostridium sp.]|uniref:type II toxin-antitoxin system antitoxin SocA domain-containing protein n=1 Tax=uncultured Clostridium sp. TaxID=59620 RepID=UPI0025F17959|nr:type II toxin-antitoxin system antitoxin SocA domain-containing protein [uncultured Clostridium sp.]
MKQYAFCEYCMKEQPYIINEIKRISTLNEEEISYDGVEACCSICRNEIFVNNACAKNLQNLYDVYRKKHNLIENNKIKMILKKYDISQEGLSLVLGFAGDTVARYLNGDMISENDSDALKKAYDSTHYYSIMLESNKNQIKPSEYWRTRKSVKYLLRTADVEKRIDGVIKYILSRNDDLTPLIIQKLLYYVQAFYFVFTDNFLFEEDLRAGDRGPEFESVVERYELYGVETINSQILNDDDLKLEDIEKNIAEGILKFYGCYSGKILEKMAENESPWILTRKLMLQREIGEIELSEEESRVIKKDLICAYFTGIKEKYNMISVLDMEKYSKDIFQKITL